MMIEHLKNIVTGFWGIGIILSIAACVVGLGHLVGTFPYVMYPLMTVVVAWCIGKFLRG